VKRDIPNTIIKRELPVAHTSSLTNLLLLLPLEYGSRDSAVDIATGCGLDDRGFGVRVPAALRIVSSFRHPDRLWGPRSLLTNGYLGPGVREADNSPPTNTEVKKTWIYTSTPPYAFTT
jgi:hypothetical protein